MERYLGRAGLHQAPAREVSRPVCVQRRAMAKRGMVLRAHFVSKWPGLRRGLPHTPCHLALPTQATPSPRMRAGTR